jgi:threonine 3-dehydrogenase
MTTLIQSGLDLSPIITHRMPYQDFERGFETMLQGHSGKVVLRWD